MPLIIKLPKNKLYLKNQGPYKSHLNVLDRKQTAVQRQLRRGGLGSFERDFQASLLALCETTMAPLSFYDIGAHIGLYSALIATIFHKQSPQIVAFEPTPDTFAQTINLRDKNALEYEVLQSAISDSCGTVDLYISGKAETSNSLNASFRNSDEAVQVPVVTIDQLVKEGLAAPTIMKIDVETFEANVLRGALETIKAHKPIFTLEILSKVERQPMQDVLGQIGALGYVFYRVEKRNKHWVKSSADEVMAKTSSAKPDWICVHDDLPSGFLAARTRWKNRLTECTEATNALVPGGQAIPEKYLGSYGPSKG
ncbi:FkbM family methyltransferase [Planktotalea sp.]|uniref:FkbM family methyltransferase n=1 Tax=Planktotalea sp. TaxID=2029877 RepID=UPI003D6C2566